MRRLLLATVAVLGTGFLTHESRAQNTPASEFAPTQGQFVAQPSAKSVANVNDNNNAQAAAIPGPFANPTPGTIVVHIDGRVHTGFKSIWSSAEQRFAITPVLGTTKIDPYALYSYARVYFGADAMATNGLRYGAATELRENFTGEVSSTASSGASAYSSTETVFVRRAFTYVAGDQWGIIRAGQADGIIGLFDNGVTTFQYLPTNNLQNGDDFAALVPPNASVPFFFLSGAGNEYGNTKLVYLSPQIAGFDFGVQWAPNTSNGYGLSGNAGGIASGAGITACGPAANSGCPTLSSSPTPGDGSRIVNQTAVGVRYQGVFSGVGVLAYGVYETSGRVNYTGPTPATAAGRTALGIAALPGSMYNGNFDNLNFGNGGLALTYAGFTIGGTIIGGRLNGQLALAPQHGVGELAYLVGAKYVSGPFTVGVAAERGDYQGSVNLTGISQRRGQAIDFGMGYTVAPGFLIYAEYQYQTLRQTGFDFITNTNGSNANNTIKSQGFLIGNVVNF
jgi:hypothetical protein